MRPGFKLSARCCKGEAAKLLIGRGNLNILCLALGDLNNTTNVSVNYIARAPIKAPGAWFAVCKQFPSARFHTHIKGFCMKAGNFFWLGVSFCFLFFFFAAYCSPEVIKHQNGIGTAKSTPVKCLFLINTSSLTERKREKRPGVTLLPV